MTKKAFSKHWKESRIEKEIEEIEKFIKFSGGIWEKNEITPSMPWTEEVKRLLGEKVTVTNEFDIDTEKLTKEINFVLHRSQGSMEYKTFGGIS